MVILYKTFITNKINWKQNIIQIQFIYLLAFLLSCLHITLNDNYANIFKELCEHYVNMIIVFNLLSMKKTYHAWMRE